MLLPVTVYSAAIVPEQDCSAACSYTVEGHEGYNVIVNEKPVTEIYFA